jgi:uncharacterized protein (DUF2267 family)
VAQAQESITADEFIRRVAERAGLDDDKARLATAAVLELLASRVTAGQMEDVAQYLPDELRQAIERGEQRTRREGPRRFTSLQFQREVARREHDLPGHAREHARAVLATLREVLPEKEWRDTLAQLPREYDELLPRG